MTRTIPDREITAEAALATPLQIGEAIAGTLLWMIPGQVQPGPNIRTDLSLDPQFLESVTQQGILQPVSVTITIDGTARLRLGARRREAAIQAGRPLPCFVLAREDDGTEEEIDALVQRWDENERRTPVTERDRAHAIQQALDLGLSEAQAAKRLRVPRATVRAGAAVAQSDTAQAAAVNQGLTLEQAATVAKYEADPGAVGQLIDAAQTGGFAQAAQQLADKAAFTAARDKVIAGLRADGISVPDEHPGHQGWLYLLAAPESDDRAALDEDSHKGCPGHSAWVTESDMYGTGVPQVKYFCADIATHGHQFLHSSSDHSGPMDDKAKAALARTKAGNAAWRAARTVRRDWLTSWLTRRSLPAGELQWALTMILAIGHEAGPLLRYQMERKHKIATALLGVTWPEDGPSWHDPAPLLETATAATGKRAEVILFALTIGALESGLTDDTWREHVPAERHESQYLAHLIGLGYDASPAERAIAEGAQYEPQVSR